ncbi:BNR/Asp-box repeat-containing protein [Pseudomonas sp. BAY1663]|uniref:WD40/YVTN/BNR-like repeat-containing protein n=1 Tax=Pseudomonas sp. BAY1663 TaxID=1439940 RepID=UPI00042E0601|nr:YCF48-related protein [Pseudomonas sp. BAY1663]EXF43937.1 BNR/Asp-box repeat-containing protein [Pseudomonas sp. BAY1663]
MPHSPAFVRSGAAPRASALRTLLLAGFPVLLSGCEAALDLTAVQRQADQPSQRIDYYQAMAGTPRVTLLAGNDGVLLASRDQGASWQRRQIARGAHVIDLDACADGSFVALDFAGSLWHSADDGTSWSRIELPSQEQMMTATCAPDGSWWVAGSYSTLLSSRDRGASWQTSSLDEDAMLTTLQFIDERQAVATGEFGLVFTSEDGGASWEPAGSLPDEFYPHAAHFRSLAEGWVGGLNGFIYHTADGGETWQRQDTPTRAPIFAFSAGADDLFAIGDHSSVLRLAGDRWQALALPSEPVYLRAAAMTAEHRLTVAGGKGLLLSLDTRPSLTAAQAQ